MLTLYHAPMSRSTGIIHLIEELGIDVDVKTVTIMRQDGSGAIDPANPHPEGKVPLLTDGDAVIRERGAIILYLTDMNPDSPLGRPVGHAQRGDYLRWLFYYQGVIEPVLVSQMLELDHPGLIKNFGTAETMAAELERGLEGKDYLLGDYSAADLLCASPFGWFPDLLSDSPVIRDWVARCSERPALQKALAADQAQMG